MGVVYFSIIPTFEPSRYYKCWIVCFYNTSIVEKFVNSLQVYVAAILNRYPDASDVGTQLQKMTNMKEIQLKFVLVVKNAEDITWLAGPLAELKARLLQIRKIWNVEIAVLNEELASQHGLLC